MSSSPLALDAATERVAVNLLRHLEWQPDGFSLVFLFADVGPSSQLADWLDQRLVLQGRPLARREADERFVHEPAVAVDALMSRLDEMSALPGASWFSVHRHPADAAWNRSRRLFLARLNERRFLLERDLHRPLVLVLPADFRAEARSIAPDIWHVRSLSEEARAAATLDSVTAVSRTGTVRVAGGQPTVRQGLATNEWQRTVIIGAGDRAYLPTAWRACEELLDAGKPAQADGVAAGALALAVRQLTEPATPRALRDLATSLAYVGRVAEAQGRWHDAEAAYRDGLARLRQAVVGVADTPEALRDVAAALRQVGRAAAAQGGWPQAEAAFREALALHRQVVALPRSATPQSLRDVSTAIEDLAKVAEARGALDEAESLYSESLATSRRALELDLDADDHSTSHGVRHLAGALNNMGRIQFGRGELGRSDAIYREALELYRLLTDPVEAAEAIQDLARVLDNVGRVAGARGDLADAEAAFSESLAVSRQLVERLGGTDESLRDLGISLQNLGRVAHQQGDTSRAHALYEEFLAVTRQRVERFGNTPDAWRELASALDTVGFKALTRGDWPQADSAYRESLALRRRLAEQPGRDDRALHDLAAALHDVARMARRHGDLAEASVLFSESLAVMRDAVAQSGETSQALRDLAAALDDVGLVAEARGDRSQAESAYREALSINRRLVERQDGSDRIALSRLAGSSTRVGRAALARSDAAAARAAFEESVVLRRQVIERSSDPFLEQAALADALLDLASVPPEDASLRRAATDLYEQLAQRFPTAQRFKQALESLRRDNPAFTGPGSTAS